MAVDCHAQYPKGAFGCRFPVGGGQGRHKICRRAQEQHEDMRASTYRFTQMKGEWS